MKDVHKLAGALEAARRAKGLSKTALSVQAGVNLVSLSNTLNGRSIPTWATLTKLCAALDFDPEPWREAVRAYHLENARKNGKEASRPGAPRTLVQSDGEKAKYPPLLRYAGVPLADVCREAHKRGMTCEQYKAAFSEEKIRRDCKRKKKEGQAQ